MNTYTVYIYDHFVWTANYQVYELQIDMCITAYYFYFKKYLNVIYNK